MRHSNGKAKNQMQRRIKMKKLFFVLILSLTTFAMAQTATNAQGVVVYTPMEHLMYTLPDDTLVALFKLGLLVICFFVVYAGLNSYVENLRFNKMLKFAKNLSMQKEVFSSNEPAPFYKRKKFVNVAILLLSVILTLPAYFVMKYFFIFLWYIVENALTLL